LVVRDPLDVIQHAAVVLTQALRPGESALERRPGGAQLPFGGSIGRARHRPSVGSISRPINREFPKNLEFS
jgi:hypothetical protein